MNIPQQVQNIELPAAIQNVGNSLNAAVNQANSGLNSAVQGFSNQAEAGSAASQGFLQSNTIIAKFAFILLVIIVFIFLFVLGINLMQYFMSPATAPFIIKGMIDGQSSKIVSTDPSKSTGVYIAHSNNKTTGLEFTWSFWLQVNGLGDSTKYQHIFNKGDTAWNATSGIASVNNAPGVYLIQTQPNTSYYNTSADNAPEGILHIVMDTVGNDNINGATTVDIPNIPLGTQSNPKWFHVAIRMQNTIMDVYINGVVSKRQIMPEVPKQNYNDINICQNGGFSGKLSNLQYFPYALNAFDINRIVYNGPNTTQDVNNSSNSSYLSSMWYTNNM